MKKSLLALAVLGAFAGAASAQSSVTVYGIVDLGFSTSDSGANQNGRTNGINSGGQSASRVGFKGTEDLGNGLKALFQLEATIAADTGAGFIAATNGSNAGGFNRFATVGLQSQAFGTVLLGRQTSVIKDAYDQIDPFGDGGTVGAISNIFFNGNLNGDFGRISNSVKYQSNSYAGFKGSAAYSFGENAGSTSANSSFGLGLGYANGPLNVQYGYHNIDSTGTGATTGATAGVPTLQPISKGKLHLLGATYDFGILKLHGAFADTKVDLATAGATDQKYRNYLLGVSAPVGPGTIFASYAVNDTKTAGVNNADTKKFAISYSYDLSKRTNLYTGYSKTSNDSGVKLGTSAANGSDPSIFNVGIRHKF
ncbi:porin [Herminiimonas sp. KBW02]|uniref:porin n=1 Tax=Herminiimonas sp. KBW02 TaxID=2153363 RepID=UPI000F596395|nr:porin [Herminiimonas sp. KBW02]RQO34278.1 porin [Herminiimonas sp. KBW02]